MEIVFEYELENTVAEPIGLSFGSRVCRAYLYVLLKSKKIFTFSTIYIFNFSYSDIGSTSFFISLHQPVPSTI